MPYSEQDAIAALNSVEMVQRRTSILRGYERGAPYFFLWGIIWIIGYTGSEFYRQRAGIIWLLLNLIGILAGLYIGKAGQSAGARFYTCHPVYWRFDLSGCFRCRHLLYFATAAWPATRCFSRVIGGFSLYARWTLARHSIHCRGNIPYRVNGSGIRRFR